MELENRTHIRVNEFRKINWLPVDKRYEQCVSMSAYKFCYGLGPAYMSDMFSLPQNSRTTRRSTHKLKLPYKRTNMGQTGISYIGPKIWNKLEDNPNKFKHNLKDLFFHNMQRVNDNIYVYY